MISIQVFCHVLTHGFVTSWQNVLFTLENIGTCVKITWNYFPCLVLHKIKVFIDDFIFALFIFMKDGKAVNYNGSEIIGLINLKYGKGRLVGIIFLPRMRYSPKKQGKGQQRGINPNLSYGNTTSEPVKISHHRKLPKFKCSQSSSGKLLGTSGHVTLIVDMI